MGDYLTLPEICVLCGKSETTMRRAIRYGRFPAASHRAGYKQYWRREVVLAAMEQRIRPIV